MAWSMFEGDILWRTNSAVLFHGHYWEGGIWFPISQSIVEPDGDGWTIKVREWLTKKNGIEEFTPYDAEDIERFNDF